MELKTFQQKAADKLVNNINEYLQDPLFVSQGKILPLYLTLKAITGSGKTIILADVLEQVRAFLQTEPIVLWVSKGKVVVGQTLDNFTVGKYISNIPNYSVMPLLDCKEINLRDNKALMLIATVSKFNQKDKEDGDRRIFQTNLDLADRSLWDLLKVRNNSLGHRRELIIVYDEGHNLSDQQTKLLDELEPITLIGASATVKVPKALEWNITRLMKEKGLTDNDLVITPNNKAVVDSGLIKKNIAVGGYLTPMEDALDSLISDFDEVDKVAVKMNVSFRPKAIYVSDTNMIANRSEIDDHKVPFSQRKARPIQIWRHLVDKGINPQEIAVYCNLKVDSAFSLPVNFNLFKGGDNDYADFVKGSYRHIIFNQTLQEGWDDPSCCFAYIDKTMGSITQVTQVIGRVLRQPGAEHYNDESLNTANFYIKTDDKDIFKNIIEEIKQTLLVDIPDVNITYHISKNRNKVLPTTQARFDIELPTISILSDQALTEIELEINKMMDYRKDIINTVGMGEKIKYISQIGGNQELIPVANNTPHSNKVTARWIFTRELNKLAKNAKTLCDISNPKFDALVEYSSNAAENIRTLAQKIANLYRDKSTIIQDPLDTIRVGAVFAGINGKKFANSAHPEYSDFNAFEYKFAQELDNLGVTWMRNPKDGYLKIPLLDGKGTDNFNPDFVVWTNETIFALDTKGKHLIMDDSQRKLFFINKARQGKDLIIKFITEKKYNDHGQVIDQNGYTVWHLKQGKINTENCSLLSEAAKLCVPNCTA